MASSAGLTRASACAALRASSSRARLARAQGGAGWRDEELQLKWIRESKAEAITQASSPLFGALCAPVVPLALHKPKCAPRLLQLPALPLRPAFAVPGKGGDLLESALGGHVAPVQQGAPIATCRVLPADQPKPAGQPPKTERTCALLQAAGKVVREGMEDLEEIRDKREARKAAEAAAAEAAAAGEPAPAEPAASAAASAGAVPAGAANDVEAPAPAAGAEVELAAGAAGAAPPPAAAAEAAGGPAGSAEAGLPAAAGEESAPPRDLEEGGAPPSPPAQPHGAGGEEQQEVEAEAEEEEEVKVKFILLRYSYRCAASTGSTKTV